MTTRCEIIQTVTHPNHSTKDTSYTSVTMDSPLIPQITLQTTSQTTKCRQSKQIGPQAWTIWVKLTEIMRNKLIYWFGLWSRKSRAFISHFNVSVNWWVIGDTWIVENSWSNQIHVSLHTNQMKPNTSLTCTYIKFNSYHLGKLDLSAVLNSELTLS